MGDTHLFKTAFSKYFPAVFAGVVLLASIVIVADDVRELSRSVPFLLAAALLVWIVFGYPRVEVSDGGITLVNVVRTVHVPWPCFTGADARWNLRIDTRSGSYTSWALPAGSGTARRLPNRREEASMTQRQLRGNTAEAAAVIIGERVTALTEAGHLGSPTLGDVEVDVSINPAAVISAAAVAACVVIALV